jgi:hypothetical protein
LHLLFPLPGIFLATWLKDYLREKPPPTSLFKIATFAGCRWLTPVILATQEAEIRRIIVRSQPGQKALKTLSRKKPITKKAGGVVQGEGPEFKLQYHKKKKKLPPLPPPRSPLHTSSLPCFIYLYLRHFILTDLLLPPLPTM